MSAGLYTITTRATGTVVTAAIYNGDHQNHVTNQNPTMTGAYSDNVTQMQSVNNPGGIGSESLASSLAGELERLRYVIKAMHGGAQWYPGILLVASGSPITPAQITANQNDYSPAGLASAGGVRLSSDASRNITGLLAAVSDGNIKFVDNIGTFPIVFKYEDAASIAENRLSFACTLGGGQSMQIKYDLTSARWRAVNLPEPLGTVKDFGTSTIPAGFLAIDQNVSRTTYASLFNIIGTAFGVGDGATTFGLFLGAGAALIASGTGTHVENGVNADVDTAADTLTVPSNSRKWVTGKPVVFTLASGTITGLTSGNTYYVIRASATTVKLASSLALAQAGTAIDFTAKSSPVWTITHTHEARTHGERLGEQEHAMNSTEALAHLHSASLSGSFDYGSDAAGGLSVVGDAPNDTNGVGGSSKGISVSGSTGSTGGNAAMNVTPISTVVTRGIRYV